MSNRAFWTFIAAVAALALAGCEDASITGAGAGTGGTGGGGTGTTTTVSITLSAGLTTLSAGGTTGLTVRFSDQTGAPFTGEATALFNSDCVANGTAQITSSTVQPTTSGTINASYLDQGCGQADTVTVSAAANGQTLSASVDITVTGAAVGSIQFVSANPSVIGIRGGGSGLPEQSAVTFKVLNTASGPASGRSVTFTLNNTAGGITFGDGTTTFSDTSGTDGTVQVVVRAGTQLTAVRVTATFTDPTSGATIASQSSALIVSTGFPDQNSFSLSAAKLNVRGFNFDGTQVIVTARLADRNNNPVPDGTAVTFTTEGGRIESECFTLAGTCSATWESQNPRPAAQDSACVTTSPGSAGTDPACANGNRAGRSTILAYAVGEESFTDLNGNGRFDNGDTLFDLTEAFQDFDENGTRDPATEPFVDFGNPGNGVFNAGDTKYNGLLCADTTGRCTTQTTLHVRGSLVIVMSGDAAVVNTATDVFIDGVQPATTVAFAGANDPVSFKIVLRDVNDQPLPEGTAITAATTLGTVTFGASQSVPTRTDDTAAANTYDFRLKGPSGADPDSGTFTITIAVGGVSGGSVTLGFPVTYTP